MESIGRGAQFEVTDLGNDRALKTLLSPEISQEVVASWYLPGEVPAEEINTDYLQIARESCAGIRVILDAQPQLAPYLGNPNFESAEQYTQDKVRVFGSMLMHLSQDEGNMLIGVYIDQLLLHWRYGFSEAVYNPMTNSGIDAQGNMVLLDLGELYFDKAAVRSQIERKAWQQHWAYVKGVPEQFRAEYQNAMNKLSVKMFDELWMTAR